jgi:hypothetical protein
MALPAPGSFVCYVVTIAILLNYEPINSSICILLNAARVVVMLTHPKWLKLMLRGLLLVLQVGHMVFRFCVISCSNRI